MDIYLILVVVLFALAISDLIVGVSNDAVNFLNSAFGSKAAPKYVILIIASLGIIIGTTFSDGMMEVARKGIFNPDQFMFSEIMIIFMAVMITDVILLDTFNTFGLPTSTTVSIVFELLGASLAVAFVKITNSSEESLSDIYKYINSAKAITIIGGILISILVAFTSGVIVQFITRLLFSFNYKKPFKYYGSIWGGIAITAITYFLLIKGAKGTSFLSDSGIEWIETHTPTLMLYSFVAWTVILQLIQWLSKINILKLIILFGTFALAMSFAGNDLVNFIGVPLAGLKSYQTYVDNITLGAENLKMDILLGKVQSNTYMLLIAGLVMAITLWLSKKARTVTQTEINLSRQDAGDERFKPTMFSRMIVGNAIGLSSFFNKIVPDKLIKFIDSRFDVTKIEKKKKKSKDLGSFDLIRASVNLAVASILISFATSLKLPLSTTYVTFMVAMGSSFTDRAWGRESAVYRITGVVTVIGGWFITAIAAFTVALTFGLIISYGGTLAIIILLILSLFFVIRTQILHNKKVSEQKISLELYNEETENKSIKEICTKRISDILKSVTDIYNKNLVYLIKEDTKAIKKLIKDLEHINKITKKIKSQVYESLEEMNIGSLEQGQYFVQVSDYLREIAHSLTYLVTPCYEHINNRHKGLNTDQSYELKELKEKTVLFISNIKQHIQANNYNETESLIKNQHEILEFIDLNLKNQVKRIKKKDTATKISLLYFDILSENKNIILQVLNLYKSQRDFMKSI